MVKYFELSRAQSHDLRAGLGLVRSSSSGLARFELKAELCIELLGLTALYLKKQKQKSCSPNSFFFFLVSVDEFKLGSARGLFEPKTTLVSCTHVANVGCAKGNTT